MKILIKILFIFSVFFVHPAQAGEGAIALTTEPKKVEILVDGQLKANTTPIVLKLSSGKHLIEMRKDGKQPESLEILITDDAVLSKQITLVDLPNAPISQAKDKLLEILEPKRQPLETDQEFLQRRQQLIDNFNQSSISHAPDHQAASVQLIAEDYDIQRHTFSITIEWREWAKRFQQPTKSSFAATREEAKVLLAEGRQKSVFLRLTYDPNKPLLNQQPIVKETVLVGAGKEWPIDTMAGHLAVMGIPALVQFTQSFVQKYQQQYPHVHFTETPSNDNKAAFTALAEGNVHFVPTLQPATSLETETFVKKYGYEPAGFRVALNILAIYVHKENPIKALNIPQLDAIFSTTRRCGYTEDIVRWEQTWVENWVATWSTLGLKGKFEGLIEGCKYENSESLDYLFFQKVALCNGEFKTGLKRIKTPQQAVNWVTLSTHAVSFGQLAYKTDKVKMVPLITKSLKSGHQGAGYLIDFIEPTVENVISGNYPLGSFIWIYVNKSPDKPLNHLEKALIQLVLSESGQNIIKEQGLIPLPVDLADSVAKIF